MTDNHALTLGKSLRQLSIAILYLFILFSYFFFKLLNSILSCSELRLKYLSILDLFLNLLSYDFARSLELYPFEVSDVSLLLLFLQPLVEFESLLPEECHLLLQENDSLVLIHFSFMGIAPLLDFREFHFDFFDVILVCDEEFSFALVNDPIDFGAHLFDFSLKPSMCLDDFIVCWSHLRASLPSPFCHVIKLYL